jgi:hypothetical protein
MARGRDKGEDAKVTPADGADAPPAAAVAPYPPPVPDAAGERTGNVPPAKQLPGDPPPEPDAGSGVPPAGAAIEAADAELARLRAENADLKRRLGMDEPRAKAAGPVTRCRVTVEGRAPDVVEIPADTPEPDRVKAATAAYQQRHGIWALPAAPVVELDVKE